MRSETQRWRARVASRGVLPVASCRRYQVVAFGARPVDLGEGGVVDDPVELAIPSSAISFGVVYLCLRRSI